MRHKRRIGEDAFQSRDIDSVTGLVIVPVGRTWSEVDSIPQETPIDLFVSGIRTVSRPHKIIVGTRAVISAKAAHIGGRGGPGQRE